MMRYSSRSREIIMEWHGIHAGMGIERPYSAQDVVQLRGSVQVEHTLARLGAERLWGLLHSEDYVPASGRSPATRPSSRCRPG